MYKINSEEIMLVSAKIDQIREKGMIALDELKVAEAKAIQLAAEVDLERRKMWEMIYTELNFTQEQRDQRWTLDDKNWTVAPSEPESDSESIEKLKEILKLIIR